MLGIIQVATMLHHSAATNTRLQVLSDCRNKLIPSSAVTPVGRLRELKGLATSLKDVGRSLTYPSANLDRYYQLPIASTLK
jgi:hypothetical protein